MTTSLLEWRIASQRFVICYHWDYHERNWGLTLAYTKLKQKKRPTLYSTSKQHEHKITRTSTTNLQIHNLPPYYRALLYQLLPFYLTHFVAINILTHLLQWKKIHITLAISALGNDTIKADTQPAYC